MDRTSPSATRFDRSTPEGRRAEMAYLDTLTDEELTDTDPGHRYVTRNPSETPQQRALLMQQLAEAEERQKSLSDPPSVATAHAHRPARTGVARE